MSTKHTANTLDQLIEKASIQEIDDRQERFYCERLKEFESSEVYRAHADLLIKLIDPLRELLPTKEEYDAYAKGKPFPRQNDATLEGMRRLVNPAIVTVNEARYSDRDENHVWQGMSDDNWNELMNSVDFIKDFWGGEASANTLDLSKAVVLHTVLYNEELREIVFRKAAEMVRIMSIPARELNAWKDRRPM